MTSGPNYTKKAGKACKLTVFEAMEANLLSFAHSHNFQPSNKKKRLFFLRSHASRIPKNQNPSQLRNQGSAVRLGRAPCISCGLWSVARRSVVSAGERRRFGRAPPCAITEVEGQRASGRRLKAASALRVCFRVFYFFSCFLLEQRRERGDWF